MILWLNVPNAPNARSLPPMCWQVARTQTILVCRTVYFSDAKNVGHFTDICVPRRSVVDTSSTSIGIGKYSDTSNLTQTDTKRHRPSRRMFSCIVSFLYRLTKTMLILNWTKLVQFDWETRARGCVCVCGLHKIRWDQGPGYSEFGYYCCERGLVIAYWLKLFLLGSFLSLRIPLNRWWLYFYFVYFYRSRNCIEQC